MDRPRAEELAARFGTPYFAYDLEEVERRHAELRAVLPGDARLFYSLKANPLPAVVSVLSRLGCRAEVSSVGELEVACQSGFAADGMLYTGPGKSAHEIGVALEAGVRTFTAESRRDIETLSALAQHHRSPAQVLLRVNPEHRSTVGLAMAGRPSQFGFDEPELVEAGRAVSAAPGLDLIGIQSYLGTQVAAESLMTCFGVGLDVGGRFAAHLPVRVLDLGGGFPWPFAAVGEPPDLAAAVAGLRQQTAAAGEEGSPELWFESGRYLVASSGTLVTRVMDVRRSRGVTLVVLDAGVCHLGGMSGLGRTLGPGVCLVALPARGGGGGAPSELQADVVGPLCTPLDYLARGVMVPDLRPGDLAAIPNVGAYGATASLTHFLSRPSAAEIALLRGEVVDAARIRTGHVAWGPSMSIVATRERES